MSVMCGVEEAEEEERAVAGGGDRERFREASVESPALRSPEAASCNFGRLADGGGTLSTSEEEEEDRIRTAS